MDKKNEPLDIQAMYEKALSSHQQGDIEQALHLYSQLATYFPEVAGIHYNLGLAYFELEQFSDAVTSYSTAADINPEDPDIFYNLGLACKKAAMYSEAERAYLKALALQPGDREILYNLGCCYMDTGAIEHARTTFESLVKLVPDYVSALNNLAYANHLLGNFDQAKELYERVVHLDPDRQSARYMYSVLSGSIENVPPQEYICELFDRFSESYDQHLVENLECSLYTTMRKIFSDTTAVKSLYDHALDLGCGTGLSGEAFRSVCRYLTGVDLSGGMIARARKKKIYDELKCYDIVEFLDTATERFDLLIAADVLPYIGDLGPLFKAAASKSTDDAIFCFSCEATLQPEWILQPSGRYAHHPDCVQKTAEETGWKILKESPTDIRKEKDTWVKGNIFLLTRLQYKHP